MHIALAVNAKVPVTYYGGTERIVDALGRTLTNRGHRVTLLAHPGSTSDYADVGIIDFDKPIDPQLPSGIDVAHIFGAYNEDLSVPHIYRTGYNRTSDKEFSLNTVFVSENHASRYGSKCFVHNGLIWEDYGRPNLNNNGTYFHFLADASWRVKNVRGAIKVIKMTPGERLEVIGGTRLNFRMGFRLTLSRRVHFNGWMGGEPKHEVIRHSKGLLFPVLWHEPFGIAMIESLFLGCPVFGTPYGSLPELINSDVGYLSNKSSDLAEAIRNIDQYSRSTCHEYARDQFNAGRMTDDYFRLYEKVIAGETLNQTPPKLQTRQEQKFLDWD